MKYIPKIVYGSLLTLLLSSSSYADCSYELFSISSTKDTKIVDFVEQLSDECEFSVIVSDPNAEKFLEKQLNKIHIKNLTVKEVLNIILGENNLFYTLDNNILKISYLKTEVFGIDYILSQRKSFGSTDVALSSSTANDASAGGSSSSQSGIKIESEDEVKFWEELDVELQSVLNRPHDRYVAPAPIINKNAGLITVTATVNQMKRFKDYLQQLQNKVQLQVLIDVKLLSVTMNEASTTGIDWQQLYALQNFSVGVDTKKLSGVSTFQDQTIMEGIYNGPKDIISMFSLSGGASINEIIKFLKTQGDVNSISNPKVLTLNNQPALITAGTEYFYKIQEATNSQSGGGTTSTQGETIKSVFAGVLLHITPEIADDRTITLKINPSLSETTTEMNLDSSDRKMPPDLNRRQLSSVVTVKDGNRVILGGLINSKNVTTGSKVPLLGDIPGLNYLFKYEKTSRQVQELVIIIEPHIIDKENSDLSLSDLGYKGMGSQTTIKTKQKTKTKE